MHELPMKNGSGEGGDEERQRKILSYRDKLLGINGSHNEESY